ncbi:MAG: hypothetical protein ACRDB7_01285 [Fusobacteriaceae bacterium]
MDIMPIGKRVLIEKILEKDEKITGGGIILASEKKSQKVLIGRVVSLGEVEGIEIDDKVIYGVEGEIEVPGEKNFCIVNQEYIYALKRG